MITCSQRTAKASQSQMMANSYMACPSRADRAQRGRKPLPRKCCKCASSFANCLKMLGAAPCPTSNNLRTFVRVYELGSMSAAGRDQRVSAAVASARIAELERHLGVRLFNRTTRSLQPTEQGGIFYKGALKILETIEEAEAAVADVSQEPARLDPRRRAARHRQAADRAADPRLQGPLSRDRRPAAPLGPPLDITAEGLDMVFVLGALEDFEPARPPDRRLPAHPLRRPGLSRHPPAAAHRPGPARPAPRLPDAPLPRRPRVRLDARSPPTARSASRSRGPLESDDGDVLTGWALSGRGIMLKPVFEIAAHLASGELVPVAEDTPPLPVSLACLYPHKRLQDPKSRLFIDFMVAAVKKSLAEIPVPA